MILSNCDRRQALVIALALTAGLPRRAHAGHAHAQQADGPARDRMQRTAVDGGERFEPRRGELFVTPYDNDPFIVAVESKLKCTCGCLHNVYECRSVDFSCGFWPGHHADIVQQATAGWTAEEIIATYLETHGQEFLMAPAARGFNLIAYVLPGTLIAITGTLLTLYLRRVSRVATAHGPEISAGEAAGPTGLSPEAEGMLAEELKKLDT